MMNVLYVISNETNEIVATIKGDDEMCLRKFMAEYGPNDYSCAYNDNGASYANAVRQIVLTP